MKAFDESKLQKLLNAALMSAMREFHEQNKGINVTAIYTTRTELNPPGMKYHITADVSVTYIPKEKTPD